MIKSDLPELEKELGEVARLFSDTDEFNIRHRLNEGENKLVNTVTVNGQTFAFGNLTGKPKDELERKRLIKRFAKLSLYKALEKITGKSLPWGALTGIRPTGLAYRLLEERGEFEEYFTDVLKVSKEKTALTAKVLNAQKGIYSANDDNTDFFVFIPFCPSRCKYCSFICADVKRSAGLVDRYVNVLTEEIKKSAKLVKKLRSIYIGGGTPIVLSESNLEKVLSAIDGINSGVEYTVEAGRPDCITKEKLEILKRHGVNRICINPQTFSDEVLKKIGRNHTAEDILRAYDLAKNDFSVNMDFIAGLDGETFDGFASGINKAISLDPDNITVHTLCIKRGADLALSRELPDGECVKKMLEYSHSALTEAGYNPYYLYRQKYMAGNFENTGYSKPTKECVYNVDTMEEISSTVACGANAISKRVICSESLIERVAAPKDVVTYLDKSEEIMQKKINLFK